MEATQEVSCHVDEGLPYSTVVRLPLLPSVLPVFRRTRTEDKRHWNRQRVSLYYIDVCIRRNRFYKRGGYIKNGYNN